MRFEEVYGDWQDKRLTQVEAARLLSVIEQYAPQARKLYGYWGGR
ncbi:hypothetical protein [Mycetohabitans endofungorum]